MTQWFSVRLNTTKQRLEGLDLLRAVAIISVLISHGSEIIKAFIPTWLFEFCYWTGGFVGVEIFFVLSGYLVGNIFIKTVVQKDSLNLRDITNFWISRWFRTLPSYYIILAIYVVLYKVTGTDLAQVNIFLYLIFSQNLAWPHPDFFNVAWSLSLEEWFYLTLPLVYISISSLTKKMNGESKLLYLLIIILIASPLLRIFVIDHADLQNWDTEIRKVTIWRLDSIMWGVLLAWLGTFKKSLFIQLKKLPVPGFVLIVFSMILLNCFPASVWQQNLLYPAMNIGTFLLVPYFTDYKFKYASARKALTNISVISYAIYLLHGFICVIFIRIFPPANIFTGILSILMFAAATYISSVIFYNYFEHPITSLRSKFLK